MERNTVSNEAHVIEEKMWRGGLGGRKGDGSETGGLELRTANSGNPIYYLTKHKKSTLDVTLILGTLGANIVE